MLLTNNRANITALSLPYLEECMEFFMPDNTRNLTTQLMQGFMQWVNHTQTRFRSLNVVEIFSDAYNRLPKTIPIVYRSQGCQ